MKKKEIQDINNMLAKKFSPTFCLAKYHHTTIYLQTGETHSCYHPQPHAISQEEIKSNPSALHNTKEKKHQRKEMLEGKKPSGCQYCWNIEALGDEYMSDRHEKTAAIYTPGRVKEIEENGWNFDVNPQYIEVSFGNQCHFKCGYCFPKASSTYYKEIEEFGPYDMVKNHRCDIDWFKIWENEESNPYVKAWWKWWPEVKKTLSILRITGGEPLLQKSTWDLFEDVSHNPLPNLELNINSNFGMNNVLVKKLCKYINDFEDHQKIKRFKVFTSIDTWGKQAEYIRTGLDLRVWENNFYTYLNETKGQITFMITFNILTVTSFKSLLKKILEWRSQYPTPFYGSHHIHRICFDTPYLKEPLQYDMNLLPKKDFMPYMYDALQFIKDNMVEGDPTKFDEIEYWKFKRVVDYMENTVYSKEKLIEGRADFYNWFTEYDKRRKTSFSETFPEYGDFMLKCKKIALLVQQDKI